MPRPRLNPDHVLTTAERVNLHRKAKKVGIEVRGKAFTPAEYREYLQNTEQRIRRRKTMLEGRFAWLVEFITGIGLDPETAIFVGTHNYHKPTMCVELETVHAAWKRAAARLHPDLPDGDAVKAARVNELWTKYKEASFDASAPRADAPSRRSVTKSEHVTKPKRTPKPKPPAKIFVHKFDRIDDAAKHFTLDTQAQTLTRNETGTVYHWTRGEGGAHGDGWEVISNGGRTPIPLTDTSALERLCRLVGWLREEQRVKADFAASVTEAELAAPVTKPVIGEPSTVTITEAEAQALIGGEGVIADRTSTDNHNFHFLTFKRGEKFYQFSFYRSHGKPHIQTTRNADGYQCEEVFPVVTTEYYEAEELREQLAKPNVVSAAPVTKPKRGRFTMERLKADLAALEADAATVTETVAEIEKGANA